MIAGIDFPNFPIASVRHSDYLLADVLAQIDEAEMMVREYINH